MSDTHSFEDIHLLTGAYAVDALNDLERKTFERHLGGCDACSVEVKSLRETASLLGVGVARSAPVELRANVLAAVARTPQAAPNVPVITAGIHAAQRRSNGLRWVASLAAAAAVIAAISYGVTQNNRANDMEQQLALAKTTGSLAASAVHDDMMHMLSDPNVKVMSTEVKGGGNVMALSLGDKIMVMGGGIKPAATGMGYQLWEIKDNKPISMGMVSMNNDGSFATEKSLTGGNLAITIEPAIGSNTPTSEPLFVMDA